MSEFMPFPESRTDFLPLCEDTVQIVPDHKGFSVPIDGIIRPYGFELQQNSLSVSANVLAVNQHGARLKTPVSGIQGIRFMGPGSDPLMGNGEKSPLVSLQYYNRDQNGHLETMRRVVLLQSVAYGIHPDHDGRAPSWYFTGLQLGVQDPDTMEYTRDEVADMRVVDIALSCVVAGPMGDPCDEMFRQLQNIPD
jgi:hypothetical protein